MLTDALMCKNNINKHENSFYFEFLEDVWMAHGWMRRLTETLDMHQLKEKRKVKKG